MASILGTGVAGQSAPCPPLRRWRAAATRNAALRPDKLCVGLCAAKAASLPGAFAPHVLRLLWLGGNARAEDLRSTHAGALLKGLISDSDLRSKWLTRRTHPRHKHYVQRCHGRCIAAILNPTVVTCASWTSGFTVPKASTRSGLEVRQQSPKGNQV
jgi:hypothetical protein